MPKQPLQKQQKEALVTFGANVRRERLRRGLTQEAFAELATLHPTVIQKIEAGKTNILATTVMRLQAVLNCPWEALFPDAPTDEAREAEYLGRKIERLSANRPELKAVLDFFGKLFPGPRGS